MGRPTIIVGVVGPGPPLPNSAVTSDQLAEPLHVADAACSPVTLYWHSWRTVKVPPATCESSTVSVQPDFGEIAAELLIHTPATVMLSVVTDAASDADADVAEFPLPTADCTKFDAPPVISITIQDALGVPEKEIVAAPAEPVAVAAQSSNVWTFAPDAAAIFVAPEIDVPVMPVTVLAGAMKNRIVFPLVPLNEAVAHEECEESVAAPCVLREAAYATRQTL